MYQKHCLSCDVGRSAQAHIYNVGVRLFGKKKKIAAQEIKTELSPIMRDNGSNLAHRDGIKKSHKTRSRIRRSLMSQSIGQSRTYCI